MLKGNQKENMFGFSYFKTKSTKLSLTCVTLSWWNASACSVAVLRRPRGIANSSTTLIETVEDLVGEMPQTFQVSHN